MEKNIQFLTLLLLLLANLNAQNKSDLLKKNQYEKVTSIASNKKLVGYDLITRHEFSPFHFKTNTDIYTYSSINGKRNNKGDKTLQMKQPYNRSGVLGFSDLVRVENPNNYPFSTVVKLETDFGVATGILIDAKHVLTAGHVIFSKEDKKWTTSVRVMPAYNGGTEPFRDAVAVNLYSWTGWTEQLDWAWDIGYMELNRPIGALTGWTEYGYNDDDSFFTSNVFYNSSYPSESPYYDGNYMYEWHGNFDLVFPLTMQIFEIGYHGQSGGGAYIFNNDEAITYAVFSQIINEDLRIYSGFVRIISQTFDDITATIASNTPSTFDLIPLNTRITPSSINSGEQLISFDLLISNYSSLSWSGNITGRIYLSENTAITDADILIGSFIYNSTLSAMQSKRIDLIPPTIPSNITPGNYYVGVILDNADANVTNNKTLPQDVASIYIMGTTTPPSPVLASPSDGMPDMPINPTLSWNSSPGATSYQLEVSKSTDFSSPVFNQSEITTTSQQIPDLDYNTLYYWHVNATNSDGTSPWSASWRFITIVESPPSPVLASPSDGMPDMPINPTLSWTSSPGAISYQLQVSKSTDFSSPVFSQSEITTTSQQIPDLDYNTLYYWHVNATNSGGTSPWSASWRFSTIAPTLVEQVNSEVPKDYFLAQNYPNPFNPTTIIQFSLPKLEFVQVKIFDQLGREVSSLITESLNAGTYEVEWDPKKFSSGIYFYQMKAGQYEKTKKMILLR